jgi:hypothetical protein
VKETITLERSASFKKNSRDRKIIIRKRLHIKSSMLVPSPRIVFLMILNLSNS